MSEIQLPSSNGSAQDPISFQARAVGNETTGCEFDYESKVWGGHEVKISPTYLGALRLRYCIEDLKGVNGSVLEVGCGAGGMVKAIKAYRTDLDVYGCDISRQAIRAAQENPRGVTFREGHAYDLPFEDQNFSAVVMFDLLEHLIEPDRAIAEAWRVLEKKGLFHLFVPCEGGLYTIHGLLTRMGWRAKEKYGGHIQRFKLKDVYSILNKQCFDVLRHRWSAHLINQIIDVAYFTGLSLRGKNTSTSVEGYLETAKPSLISIGIDALKTAVAVASYYESRIFSWFPGGGGHFAGVKRGK